LLQNDKNATKEHELLITELNDKLAKDKTSIDLEIVNFELECEIRKAKLAKAIR